MPEYAGYQSSKGVDWASIGKEIGATVDQGLKAREERKAADQKLLTDSEKKLGAWEGTQNKSYDQVILGGLDQARNKSLEWNKALKSGAISRNEYQQRMMNLNTSFDSLTQATKNFDNYITSVTDAYNNGEIGAEGMAKAKIQIDAMKMGNKTLSVGDNGDMFMVSDLDGNVPVQNVKNWSNMNNISSPKLDVSKTVDEVVGKWDPVITTTVGPNGETLSIENIRNNPAYKMAKESLIGSIVNEDDPSSVVSVLLDNSNLDYQTYYSGDDVTSLVEKAAKIKEAVDGKEMTQEEALAFAKDYKENHLIQIYVDNNGDLKSNVTPKMIKDAKDVVANKIEQRLGMKTEEQRGFAPQREPSTRAEDKEAATEQKRANEYSRGYVATMDAFGIDPNTNKRIKGKTDFSGLDNRYQYIRTSKGVQIWKSGSFDENGKENKKKSVYVGLATTPKGLAEYAVYGKSTAEAETNYEKGRTQYRGAKGIGGNTSGNKPAAQGAGDDIFGNP
jgi:hypothetical protein